MDAYIDGGDLLEYQDQLLERSIEGLVDLDVMDKVCERATSIVDTYLGFSYAGYTEGTNKMVEGWGGIYLRLPPHEQGTVTTVAVAGTALDTTGSTITGWEEQADGSLYLATGWWRGLYTITADWGYGDPPNAVIEVVLEIAVNIYRSRDKGMWTETVTEGGSAGLRFVGGLTSQQKAILDAARGNNSDVVC